MIKQEEILNFMQETKDKDILGVMRNDCVECLDYDAAKEYLKDNITEEKWSKIQVKSDKDLLKQIKEYLPFAWEKAQDKRGISASRSVQHFKTWVYIYGDKEFYDKITEMEDADYVPYGIPILECVEKWIESEVEK